METLDVVQLPPPERHSTIFQKLDALVAGDTLRLLVDHDPVPLRYQLDAARPGQFSWDPVESGPEQWVIDVTQKAHVVDARPIIAAGGEPFDTIMAAAQQVQDGQILVVYAPFEPVPLEGVLSEQGFSFLVDQLGDSDWRITFVKQ